MSKNDKADAAAGSPDARAPRRAETTARADGWGVLVDGEPLATPAGRALVLPTRALAHAVAAEWAAQGPGLDLRTMPLTRLANVALDGVASEEAAVRADLIAYAGSDLLCYRAAEPASLVGAEAAAWDPILAWAGEALGACLTAVEGVVFVAQPEAATAAVAAAARAVSSPFALAALHLMTTLTGSVVLAFAVARRRLTAQEAWRAAHVDEDEQMRVWGADDEALRRRAARWADMAAAARLLGLLDES